jgi:hypothetical protein
MNNLDSIKAIIEYYLSNTNDGDYILQALILKEMLPQGW